MLTLVLGGAASGKSEYAESLVLKTALPRYYLATMQVWDAECAALEGYFKSDMNLVTRLILALGALLLIYPGLITGAIGGVIVLGIAAFNIKGSKAPTALSV